MSRRVSRNSRGEVVKVDQSVTGKMAKLLAGEISVEEMDDEELARGQFKDSGGKFRGRPPRMVPKELHDKMVSELLKRGQFMFQESYLNAIRVMENIALNPMCEPKDRLKAAQYIIERLAGKVPDRVVLESADPWQQIIDDIIVDTPVPKPKKASASKES